MRKRRRLSSEVFNYAKTTLNAALGRVGYRLGKIDKFIVDLRQVTADPVEGCYRAGGRPFLLEVPLERCRILPASGFSCVAPNPFLDTMLAHAAGKATGYKASPLRRFYETWQPASAAEVVGLADGAAEPLRAAPPLGFVFPWGGLDPAESHILWQRIIAADYREHGISHSAQAGWKGWGPIDEEIGGLEFARLVSVYEAVKAQGYRRNDEFNGDIGGVALCNDDGFAVLVTAGHHRCAALAALDYRSAPIRFLAADIIRRSEVMHWPNVRSGLFQPEQALAIFDRLFSGRQPAGCVWPPTG